MKKRPRKKNSEGSAAALTEAFHGRPVRKVREIEETVVEPEELADLGRLLQLVVILRTGRVVELNFAKGAGRSGSVRLGASGDGGQLYIVGGDQELDLPAIGLDAYLPKNWVEVGEVQFIVYFTSKAFHNFEPTQYTHEFGEEGGEMPTLLYDVLSKKLGFAGGSYTVEPEGIRN